MSEVKKPNYMQDYVDMTLRQAGYLGRATALLDSVVDLLGGKYPTLFCDSAYRKTYIDRIQDLLDDMENDK